MAKGQMRSNREKKKPKTSTKAKKTANAAPVPAAFSVKPDAGRKGK